MSSKTITIISTKHWEPGTLFNNGSVEIIDNPVVNRIFTDFFGKIDWTTCFSEDRLNELYESVIKQKLPHHRPDRLKGPENKEYREQAFEQIPELKQEILENKNYKKRIKDRSLVRIKGTDVYGIKSLMFSREEKDWISTLLSVAKIISGEKAESIKVYLFLHDTDIKNNRCDDDCDYKPVTLEEVFKNDDNKPLSDNKISDCKVVYFKHKDGNFIYNLIMNPLNISELQSKIDDFILKEFVVKREMIADALTEWSQVKFLD